jgi:hypothetical protein
VPITIPCHGPATILGDITQMGAARMTDREYFRKLSEVDGIINDPDVPMRPAEVWALVAELARHEGMCGGPKDQPSDSSAAIKNS